jgi:hypothetical protein
VFPQSGKSRLEFVLESHPDKSQPCKTGLHREWQKLLACHMFLAWLVELFWYVPMKKNFPYQGINCWFGSAQIQFLVLMSVPNLLKKPFKIKTGQKPNYGVLILNSTFVF